MKALVVYAHPVEGSFCSSMRDRVVQTLTAAGHEVDMIDLYAERFDPALTAEEYELHNGEAQKKPELAEHLRRLAAAEALVFVYPTWWGGQPAMLKGWFDRVLPDIGCTKRALIGPQLRRVRRLVVVTTHGSSKWVNALQGESGKRVILRGLRRLAHPMVRGRWVALYGVDRSTGSQRERFLNRVQFVLSRL